MLISLVGQSGGGPSGRTGKNRQKMGLVCCDILLASNFRFNPKIGQEPLSSYQ